MWSAVADYFKAPAGFERFIDKPVQPLPIYLTLQHLGNSKKGKYIDTIKGEGALKDIFARDSDGSSSAGSFWLAEHNDDARDWLSDRPVLSVSDRTSRITSVSPISFET
jgi:hypothetical protein